MPDPTPEERAGRVCSIVEGLGFRADNPRTWLRIKEEVVRQVRDAEAAALARGRAAEREAIAAELDAEAERIRMMDPRPGWELIDRYLAEKCEERAIVIRARATAPPAG